jgi:hypothetical protein
MLTIIERVMTTFGLKKPLPEQHASQTREALLDFLSRKPGTNEHTATAEELAFLKNLET